MERLIAGNGAYICNDCIMLCVNMMQDDLQDDDLPDDLIVEDRAYVAELGSGFHAQWRIIIQRFVTILSIRP